MNPRQRFFLTVAVMASTVMQVLDTTIVNVALPQMQGELGATPDQISWVLTSYLVASAVMMPLTGFFTAMLGRRRFLLVTIAGFVVASMLCGVAQNLTEIVLFRILQGIFGAALVPLAQAVMVDTYPLEERARAMAIWAMGVMVGPIAGPTLGGWLTESLDWRWTFFINLPVGILSWVLASQHVPDSPRVKRRMDWHGFVYLGLAIGGLQYFLDRGNSQDWFSANDIIVAALTGTAGLALFIGHSLRDKGHALFSLTIFRDRNFVTSSIVIIALGLGMYGAMVLQPVMLESLLHYPAATAGLVMAPRGLASMASMMLVSRVMKMMDARAVIALGVVMGVLGNYLCTQWSLDVSAAQVVLPSLLQGFGLGFIVVPLSTIALSSMPRPLVPDASGLYSLLRTLGSSVGIALISTVYARETQMNWQALGTGLQPYNPVLHDYLARLPANEAGAGAIARMAGTLMQQAGMVAVVNSFWWITASFLAMLPMVLLLRPLPKAAVIVDASE
ncbi:MAG TPA: DHA2 family efflux MFS transporter permease subunit [Moraxellaceae bacterium]|nr:DHA2 family efflux MFS transporter permease subunit [Moraxellaceae bacterium]